MKSNHSFRQKLADLLHCSAELDKRRLLITDIKIHESRNPLITIQAVNKTPGGLTGAMKIRINRNKRLTETYATNFCGCQVEWQVSA